MDYMLEIEKITVQKKAKNNGKSSIFSFKLSSQEW